MAVDLGNVNPPAAGRPAERFVRYGDHLDVLSWRVAAELIDIGTTAKEARHGAAHHDDPTSLISLRRIDRGVQLAHKRDAVAVGRGSVHFDDADIAFAAIR